MSEVLTSDGRPRRRPHSPVIDALVVVLVVVLLAALGFGGSWRSFTLLPFEPSPWAVLFTTIPAAVFLMTKRRAPLLSLIGAAAVFSIDLVTVGSVGPLLVLLDVLWLAVFQGSERTRRWLLVAIVATVGVLVVGSLVIGEADLPVALLIGAQFGAIFGTDYWWAVAMAQANELAELHRQRADAATAAADRDRAEAVREERETMARELHDVVAGHVLAMAIRAEAALSTPPAQTADRAALQAVRDAGLDAHAALRTMISVLRHDDGETMPTPSLADLDGIINDARRAGLRVHASLAEMPVMPPALEQAVVRVVREALSNCARHASGADVIVTLSEQDSGVRVRIDSQGGTSITVHGYAGNGWGLSMLRERVSTLGGDFAAGPTAEGWTVEAVIPREVAA
ncbi:sensor histidine kinase [Microbacterium keratanolyticum]